jgi:putative membrane protein
MGLDWLKPGVMLGTVLYALIGVVLLWLSFVAIDKLTPYKLWEELCEKKNVALGIVIAGLFIAIGQVIAAAIHG